ncbi:MAG TPA: J domain-containing protein [Methylomirabilota bacterium]|nr:J domain-containing protein [Methylomirabilota bacterium]
MNQQRYPLAWPAGWRRTEPRHRQRARFSQSSRKYSSDGQQSWRTSSEISVYTATQRLRLELDRLGAANEILSTNLVLRLDGLPRSDQRDPLDPGAAVYFQLEGKPRTLACDRWLRVADNIAAIAAHIEAIRAVDRYGVGTLEQAFAGYAALPAGEQWFEILGVLPTASLEQIDDAYRKLAKAAHPDHEGGSHDAMARLNQARETGRKLRA